MPTKKNVTTLTVELPNDRDVDGMRLIDKLRYIVAVQKDEYNERSPDQFVDTVASDPKTGTATSGVFVEAPPSQGRLLSTGIAASIEAEWANPEFQERARAYNQRMAARLPFNEPATS